MGVYSGRKRLISGNNGTAKDYAVLNITARIYFLLKDSPDKIFTLSTICKECGDLSISQTRPKLMFLLKINAIEKVKYTNLNSTYYRINKYRKNE